MALVIFTRWHSDVEPIKASGIIRENALHLWEPAIVDRMIGMMDFCQERGRMIFADMTFDRVTKFISTCMEFPIQLSGQENWESHIKDHFYLAGEINDSEAVEMVLLYGGDRVLIEYA